MNQFPPAAAAAPVVCRPATVEIGKVIMEMTKFGRRYIVVCAGGKERRRKKKRAGVLNEETKKEKLPRFPRFLLSGATGQRKTRRRNEEEEEAVMAGVKKCKRTWKEAAGKEDH